MTREAEEAAVPSKAAFGKSVVAEREGLKVVRLTVSVGGAVPEHHANVDVVAVVTRGRGFFTVEGVERAISAGSVVEMRPRVRHSLRADGEELELVVVHARLASDGASTQCGA